VRSKWFTAADGHSSRKYRCMNMGLYNLDKIFKAESIAVVGASEKEGSIGHAIMQNLIKGGYEGKIVPINPRYSIIHGLKAFPSISKTNSPIDLAIIAIPISTIPPTVRECVEVGVGGGYYPFSRRQRNRSQRSGNRR